jgi:general secretion pathway protein C
MNIHNKLYSAILVALLTVSAYCLADTVDAVIGRSLDAAPKFTAPVENKPVLEPRRELNDYSSILERGLFGEGKSASSAPAAAEAVNFKLIGTVEGEVFAGAVIEDATGQAFYRIQQKLSDGSQIVKVLRDRVTLRRADGSSATLQIVDETKIVAMVKPTGGGSGVRKLSDNKFAVDQREIAASTENMSQLLTQARALPYVEQGKTVGFRISEIVPGSLYEKIGLQNGDVIRKINSQDVDDPGKFFQLYQGLKEERNISIDVMRGGQRQTFNYDIR